MLTESENTVDIIEKKSRHEYTLKNRSESIILKASVSGSRRSRSGHSVSFEEQKQSKKFQPFWKTVKRTASSHTKYRTVPKVNPKNSLRLQSSASTSTTNVDEAQITPKSSILKQERKPTAEKNSKDSGPQRRTSVTIITPDDEANNESKNSILKKEQQKTRKVCGESDARISILKKEEQGVSITSIDASDDENNIEIKTTIIKELPQTITTSSTDQIRESTITRNTITPNTNEEETNKTIENEEQNVTEKSNEKVYDKRDVQITTSNPCCDPPSHIIYSNIQPKKENYQLIIPKCCQSVHERMTYGTNVQLNQNLPSCYKPIIDCSEKMQVTKKESKVALCLKRMKSKLSLRSKSSKESLRSTPSMCIAGTLSPGSCIPERCIPGSGQPGSCELDSCLPKKILCPGILINTGESLTGKTDKGVQTECSPEFLNPMCPMNPQNPIEPNMCVPICTKNQPKISGPLVWTESKISNTESLPNIRVMSTQYSPASTTSSFDSSSSAGTPNIPWKPIYGMGMQGMPMCGMPMDLQSMGMNPCLPMYGMGLPPMGMPMYGMGMCPGYYQVREPRRRKKKKWTCGKRKKEEEQFMCQTGKLNPGSCEYGSCIPGSGLPGSCGIENPPMIFCAPCPEDRTDRTDIKSISQDQILDETAEMEQDEMNSFDNTKGSEELAETVLSQTDLRKTQTDIRNTQTGLRNTQRDMRNTQTGLRNTQRDMRNTQMDMRNTQTDMRNTHTHDAQATMPGVASQPDVSKRLPSLQNYMGTPCPQQNPQFKFPWYESECCKNPCCDCGCRLHQKKRTANKRRTLDKSRGYKKCKPCSKSPKRRTFS